jgi:seryl-tRNA synthetase
MLDIKFVRENLKSVEENLIRRGKKIDFLLFSELDKKRLSLISDAEKLKAERNRSSKLIGNLMKEGKKDEAEKIKTEMKDVADKIKGLDEKLSSVEEELNNFLLGIPNLLDDSVPFGKSEDDNVEVKKWGKITEFSFTPKPHEELAAELGILDLDVSAKLSGSRFSYLSGKGARLERALVNFFLDLHTKEHGYTECMVPLMVNSKSMKGTGQLPKFSEDLFKIEERDLWLIPTAEVPLTNVYSDTILDEAMLPVYMCAYTPCFRSEAGSYGKDTKGLIRLHQFNKVELVKFVKPEESDAEHEKLLLNAEKILQMLNIPYRVVSLCSGDIGFGASKCYDIEVWVPSQQKYREISSCSNFKDFQSRRAGIKYRKKSDNKSEYLHTINGSGLAVGRTWVAILENFQDKDGRVRIPECLVPYTGFEYIEKS